MSEDDKVACDSCEYRGIASLAVKFCRSCQEHLCKDCIDLHKSFKLTRGHLLADIGDKHTLLLCSGIENLRMCQLHPNKPLEFYCWVHEQLLCSLCIIKAEQHIKCNKTIVDIDSVGKSLTSCHLPEMAKFEFQKSISRARDTVQEMKEIENESTMKTEGLKADIKQLRAKIIKTFDEKTKGIIKKADKINTGINEKYSKSTEKLENIIKTAETNKSLLESVLESGTPDDVFRCSVRMLELIGEFKLETEKEIEEEYIKQEFDILKSDLFEMLEKFDKPLVQFQVKETKIKRSLIDHKEQPYEVMKNQLISLCSIEDKRDALQKDNVEQEDVNEMANSHTIETAQTQLEKISNSSDAMEIDKPIHEEHENTATVKKDKEYVELTEYDISLEHKSSFPFRRLTKKNRGLAA
ncbi:E3 ubiquitin-protein ligase TRIM45-like [Ruditapes philippinarum]|uniref:E3 ubiquitin-protein ligase TRIM45-like n=1 Tax=Ruditapes philippinarum TaxID=129788 RepID=UPI00295C36BE|nr:E3 ubiquitin-protein ligase TRIM45-like [Ruditapes philippinarum]